jgi:hypothetical protein
MWHSSEYPFVFPPVTIADLRVSVKLDLYVSFLGRLTFNLLDLVDKPAFTRYVQLLAANTPNVASTASLHGRLLLNYSELSTGSCAIRTIATEAIQPLSYWLLGLDRQPTASSTSLRDTVVRTILGVIDCVQVSWEIWQ